MSHIPALHTSPGLHFVPHPTIIRVGLCVRTAGRTAHLACGTPHLKDIIHTYCTDTVCPSDTPLTGDTGATDAAATIDIGFILILNAVITVGRGAFDSWHAQLRILELLVPT